MGARLLCRGCIAFLIMRLSYIFLISTCLCLSFRLRVLGECSAWHGGQPFRLRIGKNYGEIGIHFRPQHLKSLLRYHKGGYLEGKVDRLLGTRGTPKDPPFVIGTATDYNGHSSTQFCSRVLQMDAPSSLSTHSTYSNTQRLLQP
jgi:hypothetical protein